MSENKLEPEESDSQIDQEESQKGSGRDEEILREKPPHHQPLYKLSDRYKVSYYKPKRMCNDMSISCSC